MTILEQIEEKNNILSEYVDRIKEGEVLSQEDKEKRDAAFAQLQELRKAQAMELELEKGKLEAEKRELEAQKAYRDAKISTPSVDDKVEEYREAFERYIRYGETRTVTDYQNKGVAADGGYLAPADFYNAIVEKRNAASIIRPLATVLKIDGNMNIPVEGSDATGAWVAEGGSITGTKQAFAQVALNLQSFALKIGVTYQMLRDSKIDIVKYLAGKMARLFVEAEETAFMSGTAANNQPVGILSSGITTTRTASASAVALADVVGLYEALPVQYRNNAVWIVGTAMEAAMMQMVTSGGYPLWQNSYQPGVPNTFLGRPIFVSPNLDNTIAASKYEAVFGDLSYYYIGDNEEVLMARFDHRDVDGRYDFLGIERVAGALTNTDAVKILQCKAS